MRVKIFYHDPIHGGESLENIRNTDEIAEAQGMTDAEADAMESALEFRGWFMLDAHRRLLREVA